MKDARTQERITRSANQKALSVIDMDFELARTCEEIRKRIAPMSYGDTQTFILALRSILDDYLNKNVTFTRRKVHEAQRELRDGTAA
jgi:hypothetical protein